MTEHKKETYENKTEAQNDDLHVTMKREPGSKVTLNIVVKPKAVNASYTAALKAVNKEVSLPGFRKGKAPDSTILKKYGTQVIKEWREYVLNKFFQDALKLLKLNLFNKEGIKCEPLKELARDKEAHFTIHCEVAPTIPEINLKEITLPHVAREDVTEGEIEDAIHNVLLYYAEWTPVTDRAVQEGDYVDLDIEKLEGESPEAICKDTRFLVKKGNMANWMRKMIMGHYENETVGGMSENEEDIKDFKPTHCRITIKKIQTATMPELDDEFAQKVGAENVESLKEKVVEDLNRKADQEVLNELRQKVDEFLLEKYHFDIPQSLIDEEKKARLNDAMKNFEKQQLSKEEIEHRKAELEKRLPKDVDHSYRLYFLFLAFANVHKISVPKDEVAKELASRIYGTPNAWGSVLSSEFEELRGRVGSQIMMRKCRDYIVKHSKNLNLT